MEPTRRYLSESIERLRLQGDEAKAILRRLLQSQAEGASDIQLKIANALFAAADSAAEMEKRLYYDALFLCLMRALEDFAMLSLMGWDDSRHPLDIYLNLDRPEIRAFYSRARKGLGEEIILKLMGVGNWTQLKRLPAFQGQDFSADEDALDWQVQEAREILIRCGKLYHTTPEDADDEIGAWQLSLAKTSVGLKLLIAPENETPLMLLGTEQADPARPGPSTAFFAKVNVGAHFAERILGELEMVCREIKRLAERRLVLLEDPLALAKGAKAEYQTHLKQVAGSKAKEAAAAQAEAEAGGEPGVHEETRHDKSPHKVVEVGGLKIYHSKPRTGE